MDWLFEGLGTLVIGLLVGGAGGSAVTWKIAQRSITQRQRAANNSHQVQAGRDARSDK